MNIHNHNHAKFISSARSLACAAMLLAAVVLATSSAQPANYPDKPIRLIVAFGPVGRSDIAGRFISAGLSQRLGQQVVVDNKHIPYKGAAPALAANDGDVAKLHAFVGRFFLILNLLRGAQAVPGTLERV